MSLPEDSWSSDKILSLLKKEGIGGYKQYLSLEPV